MGKFFGSVSPHKLMHLAIKHQCPAYLLTRLVGARVPEGSGGLPNVVGCAQGWGSHLSGL
eukprot:4848500-Pyramimonas_sp.AAC.1